MRYETCPECHYTRPSTDDSPADICPSCGLVFWKWEKYHSPEEYGTGDPPRFTTDTGKAAPFWQQAIWDHVGHCPATDWFTWSGRCGVLLALCAWGGWFVLLGPSHTAVIGECFLHRVNLVFHEAGHVLFSPFGDFLHVMGGSLGQVLMPLIVMLSFLVKDRDPFAAAVGLWWIGQSAMDISIYIDDARSLELPLLGGGTGYDNPDRHDWNNLLARLGLLDSDHVLAQSVYMIGRLLMVAACLWGGVVLYRQVCRLLQTSRQGT